jgi:predicted lipid-binding transport protein (Tim44 family)
MVSARVSKVAALGGSRRKIPPGRPIHLLFICHLYLSRAQYSLRACSGAGSKRGFSAAEELDRYVTVEIVILAMIAAFLGLRLYSVLGRRAEHEEEPIQGRFDAPASGGPAAPAPRGVDRPADRGQTPPRLQTLPGLSPAVERGLRDIAAADRRFDALTFLEGARGAYRMILEAFWRGDREELAQLCDRDVYDAFAGAIDARLAAGETLENRLVRIDEAVLVGASYAAPHARITVRFVADIAAVTRDAEGTMVAGSLNDAIEARDVWTFSRDLTSADPDWLLDETDEA